MEQQAQGQQAQGQVQGGRMHSIPLEILDDLASRFIINAPEGEKQDLIRMCFQIELAHWFFIDEYVSDRSNRVHTCTMREFAEHMFNHVQFLREHSDRVEQVIEEWRAYKMSVPTYGAVIINQDLNKVLLVQGFWTKTSWGFPKGKVNEDESPHDCAAREVLEETGYDVAPFMDPQHYLEAVIQDQTVWLYPIPGVPEDTKFQPRTKNEIRDLRWFSVADLPANKKEAANRPGGLSPNSFFMVMPFVKNLKKWLSAYQRNLITFNPGLSNYKDGSQAKKISKQGGQKTPSAKNKNRKVSKTAAPESNKSPMVPEVPAVDCSEYDVPKVWAKFKFNKKDILSAMSSTPGWIE